MDIRDRIIEVAKSHVGKKWQHQARKDDAMDCAGLLILVGKELDLLPPDFVDLRNYRRTAVVDSLKLQFDKYCTPKVRRKLKKGDLGIFGWGKYNFHCGIIDIRENGELWLIHSYYDAGKVVEHPLSEEFSKHLTHVYSYKGVD